MRIIAGLAKGCALSGPGDEKIRPTPDKVRQALFNIINADGSVFLDLFAGTGAVGCEALSRGASAVTMVDSRKSSLEIIKKNAEKTVRAAQAGVRPLIVRADAEEFVHDSKVKYDFIFCDPPYEWDGKSRLIDAILDGGILKGEGALIFECAFRDAGEIVREPRALKRYGDTALLFFG
jgi:16S rRNA (guanine(966)-N(2))-methyltransferase RsmD